LILVVSGMVRGHHEISDGEWITSSAVAWFDRKMRFVRTHSRVYTLGQSAGVEIPSDGVVSC
jgi:hypothetical protein